MHIWVVQSVYEGEPFSSVHMTEKGVLVAAVVDVLEFLGVECKETALNVRNRQGRLEDEDGNLGVVRRRGAMEGVDVEAVPYEWDPAKLREMTRAQLRHTFRKWNALTWDNYAGYYINIEQKTLQP